MLKKKKKEFKIKKSRFYFKNCNIHYSNFAIQSIENNNINLKQIEAFKKIIKKKIKKYGLYIKVPVNHPITKKKKNSRMGKGKGNIEYFVSKIKKGQILFELNCKLNFKKIKIIFKTASTQLPIKIRILCKNVINN